MGFGDRVVKGLGLGFACPRRVHLDALGLRAYGQLRMLSHAALDDLGDVLQGGAELLLLVVAQPDGVGELRLHVQGRAG